MCSSKFLFCLLTNAPASWHSATIILLGRKTYYEIHLCFGPFWSCRMYLWKFVAVTAFSTYKINRATAPLQLKLYPVMKQQFLDPILQNVINSPKHLCSRYHTTAYAPIGQDLRHPPLQHNAPEGYNLTQTPVTTSYFTLKPRVQKAIKTWSRHGTEGGEGVWKTTSHISSSHVRKTKRAAAYNTECYLRLQKGAAFSTPPGSCFTMVTLETCGSAAEKRLITHA